VMMRRALLGLGLLGTAGLIAAAALGYGLRGGGGGDAQARAHVLLSLGATMVLLFSHTWIVLYLVATGGVVSRLVRERGYEADFLARARRLRLRALPWLLAALVLVVATFLVGNAVLSGAAPAAVHHALFYCTLAVQVGAMAVERRVLAEHDGLRAELVRRVEADAA
jgi:hypothetical protein